MERKKIIMISVTLLKAFAKINDIESEEDLDNFCMYVAELVVEVETLEGGVEDKDVTPEVDVEDKDVTPEGDVEDKGATPIEGKDVTPEGDVEDKAVTPYGDSTSRMILYFSFLYIIVFMSIVSGHIIFVLHS